MSRESAQRRHENGVESRSTRHKHEAHTDTRGGQETRNETRRDEARRDKDEQRFGRRGMRDKPIPFKFTFQFGPWHQALIPARVICRFAAHLNTLKHVGIERGQPRQGGESAPRLQCAANEDERLTSPTVGRGSSGSSADEPFIFSHVPFFLQLEGGSWSERDYGTG